jgi:hypothetical protein
MIKIFRQWFHHFEETTSLLEQEGTGGLRTWSDVNLIGRVFIKFTPKSVLRHPVAQLVEVLRYKPEGRGIPRMYHWNFLLASSFWLHCGFGVDSASNRNEYQEYFLGAKAAGA